MEDYSELGPALKKIIRKAFSNLEYSQTLKAEVVKVYEDEENQYYLDLHPLTRTGQKDPDKPVIPKVELPVIWAGNDRGVFAVPEVGAKVRVGFDYNDPSHPYIMNVLWDGYTVPKSELGSFVIQHSKDMKIEITKDGSILIKAIKGVKIEAQDILQLLAKDIYINVEFDEMGNPINPHPVALGDILEMRFLAHTHMLGSAPTTPPVETMVYQQNSNTVKVGG